MPQEAKKCFGCVALFLMLQGDALYLPCSVSIAALANNDDAPRNVSIMAQGAILGSTIGGMVKDNSSSIAG